MFTCPDVWCLNWAVLLFSCFWSDKYSSGWGKLAVYMYLPKCPITFWGDLGKTAVEKKKLYKFPSTNLLNYCGLTRDVESRITEFSESTGNVAPALMTSFPSIHMYCTLNLTILVILRKLCVHTIDHFYNKHDAFYCFGYI